MLKDFSNREVRGDLFLPAIPPGKFLGIGLASEVIGFDPPVPASSGNSWAIASSSIEMEVNTNYVVDGSTRHSLLLPAAAELGDNILILGQCDWRITQNAGNLIRHGNKITVSGISGYIESSVVGDCVAIACTGEGNWIVYHSQGVISGEFEL